MWYSFLHTSYMESALSIGICQKIIPSLNSLRDNALKHNPALCRHGWPDWLRPVKDSMMTLT